jgi:hypothetical protein
MKLILALCLAILCLTTHGQTNKLPVPRDAYVHHQAMVTHLAPFCFAAIVSNQLVTSGTIHSRHPEREF